MNKIFFFCLMASLVSLRASDEESSSPLMVKSPGKETRNDEYGYVEYKRQPEHNRQATDGQLSTPPQEEEENSSGCTTGESVGTISRFQWSESKTRFGSGSPISRSLLHDRNDPLVPKEAQDNLMAAQAEIAEALERCNSISPRCSTRLVTAKKQALEELSAVLSRASVDDLPNTWCDEPISYQNLAVEVASKIQAAKEVCEIEDSQEATNIANAKGLHQQDKDKESNLHQELLARSAQHLEDCQRIKNKILSDIVPYNHYDPLHPIVLANTTLTDGIQFPLILPTAFGMQRSDCVNAGLAANLVSAFAASPYLQAQLLQRVPRCSHPAIRNIDGVIRQLVDIPYVFYYVPGWYELKLGAFSRIAGLFILPSAIARKLTWRLFQSKAYRGSLEQRAEALTSVDPRWTATQWAFKDALERFGPDIVAATARSFFSNLYDYHQGTISAEEVFTKTVYSAGVYTIATIGFYTFYRIVEAVMIRTQVRAAGSYQDFARADLQKIQRLKTSLSALKSSPSNSRSLVDSPPQSEQSKAVIQHLTDAGVDSLSHTLKFLDSPVANLMGDPFYRCRFSHDQNAIESFRALDALKFLRTMLPSLKSANVPEQQQAYAALTTLKNYLMPNADYGDIESESDTRITAQNFLFVFSRFSTDAHDPIPQNKIDALIEFFEKFSIPPPSTPKRPESLLRATRYPAYHAVSQNGED
ncbi:MAG: hypothetical protein K2W97_00290 [Chthoniobacterales bacterium]|nr:hypothetical protein [Chthoniobacterales bacterium]